MISSSISIHIHYLDWQELGIIYTDSLNLLLSKVISWKTNGTRKWHNFTIKFFQCFDWMIFFFLFWTINNGIVFFHFLFPCSHIPFPYWPSTTVGFFEESRPVWGQRAIENAPIMTIAMTIGHIRLASDAARVISDETSAGINMMRNVVFVRNSRTGKLIPLHLLLVKKIRHLWFFLPKKNIIPVLFLKCPHQSWPWGQWWQ